MKRTPLSPSSEDTEGIATVVHSAASAMQTRTSRSMPLIFYAVSFLAAIGAALVLRGFYPGSLADLSNLMGPLAENLAHGRGYVICTDAMTVVGNSVCYHAGRMPLPPLLLAGLIRIFGDHYLPVELAKIAIVLLPIAATIALVETRVMSTRYSSARIFIPIFLFVALVLPTQLIDVVNMQVEEGYSFCLLTYAVAVLLFGFRQRNISWRTTIFFSLSVLALYLTKSSMIVAVVFFVVAFWQQTLNCRKRIAVVSIVVCGPLGWGLYTLHASGRFSVGTSLDGINLHKGNNPQFLDRYPPSDNGSLDRYDISLNDGNHFSNEWEFNAFHMKVAESHIQSHPAQTIKAAVRKAHVFLISMRKIGSEQYSGWLGVITDISMVSFRLLLWSACVIALWFLARGPHSRRVAAIIYLGTVCTVAAPYLVGFALTRHASVLILPAALFLCWLPTLPQKTA